MKTLTIISPVYNEAEVIECFYNELKSEIKKLTQYNTDILFVVDRSSDSTLAILKNIAMKDSSVHILALSSRFGHQMSLLAGIDASTSDIVVMMDSDLQHPPALLLTLLEKYGEGNEIVHAVRKNIPQIGFFKQTASSFFYYFFNSISETPVIAGAADFRLISKRVASIFRENIRERNMFLRGLASWIGFQQATVAYNVRERGGGHSKYSLGRLLQFGIHGALSFSRKPLRMAIAFGVIFSAFGFLYAMITFAQHFIAGNLPPGWTTIIILLSIFSGVQLICLGVIGEYIGEIFDEVKQRPHYIIDEKINFK